MYNEYFGFKEAPFSIAPDPRYLYMTAQHREALAHLVFGLNSEGGCILLTGEVGTGKTTICRCLLEQIPDEANVALLLNPKVNEIELLETVCDELHISYPDADNSVKTYTDRIYQFLIESNRRNEKTVLIIDEAQNLDSKVLEQLRLLTNLETNQHKLLQIIILGQPELLDILARSEMRQLAQRITARFHLEPLNKHEVKAYIGHRLAVAGQNIQLFPENSIRLLYKLSRGIPRLINIICDRALLGAYVENQYSVTPGIMKKAATEVFGELKNVERHQQKKRWLYPLAAIASIAFVIILASYYFSSVAIDALPSLAGSDETTDTISDNDAPDTQAAEATEQTTDQVADQATTAIAKIDVDTADHPATTKNDDRERLTSTAVDLADTDDEHNTGTVNIMTADGNATETASSEPADASQAATTGQPAAASATDTAATQKNDITDDIESVLNSAPSYPMPAYQQLFHAWNRPFDKNTRITACKQAEKLALSCLYKTGNINSLKLHDRPAVLTLLNERGGKRYITITAVDGDVATVHASDKTFRIKLQDLDRYWYGQFILLWNRPADYTTAVSPGESGSIVNWLDQQLARINDAYAPEHTISKYSRQLVNKVKAFQSQHGLAADGIVGPVTIIHLNKELGIAAPSLKSPAALSVVQQN